MDYSEFLNWFKLDENRKAAASIIAILAFLGATLAGLQKLFLPWFKEQKNTAELQRGDTIQTPMGHVTLPLSAYVEALEETKRKKEKELRHEYGSERVRLLAEIDELISRLANPDDALKLATKRIAEIESHIGEFEDHDELEARAALEVGDFDTAREIFLHIEALTTADVRRNAEAHFALGQIAEEQIRWKEAEFHFNRSVELLRAFDSLCRASQFSRRMFNMERADRHSEVLVEFAVSEFGQYSEEYALALSERTQVLRELGKYESAEPLLRTALAITESGPKRNTIDHAIRLTNLAWLLRNIGNFTEAEPLFRQSIEIAEACVGMNTNEYATRLSHLGWFLKQVGRSEEAINYFEQALEITKAVLGEQHPQFASRLNSLAETMRQLGRNEEAIPLFRRSLNLTKSLLGEEHPLVAERLNNIAEAYRASGKYDLATKHYQEAMALYKLSGYSQRWRLATVISNLADLNRQTKNLVEAEMLFEESILLARECGADRTVEFALMLNNLALVLQERGRVEDSSLLIKEAFDVVSGVSHDQSKQYQIINENFEAIKDYIRQKAAGSK